jgi:serine protease AprX
MTGTGRTARVGALLLAFLAVAVLFAALGTGFSKDIATPANAGPAGTSKLWVFFNDKALGRADASLAIEAFEAKLAPRALWRRGKVGLAVNENDLPVATSYVDEVRATGATVVMRSRWLNAISVYADTDQAARIAALPFVKDMRPVAHGSVPLPEMLPAPAGPSQSRGTRLDYGSSFGQLDQIQVTDLHTDGFDGTGVVIAMLDSGFDTSHQVYHDLKIIGERDFINNDRVTANQPGDPSGQDSHGTSTLSCVGGAYAGKLYGGSYNASFILAKTERIDVEIQIEEDYWAAAIEWADSLGADLVSSSLGYLDWYTYEDMDGNTAVTTKAADMAAARGIVVVNSMGNEGNTSWLYMIAPADGDSVVSVGAVNSSGVRVSFSSIGPTYDGRIKPDVMAQGRYVYVASTTDTAAYASSSGTSFSCPLTAGAIGLLLEGHPEWRPVDVITALHETATQNSAPDVLMGWGIVQAADAMNSETSIEETPGSPASMPVIASYPNPFLPGATLECIVPAESHVALKLYDPAGRLVRVLYDGVRPGGLFTASWDGKDSGGASVANGVYFARISAGGVASSRKITLIR